jgi:hypothetical protein
VSCDNGSALGSCRAGGREYVVREARHSRVGEEEDKSGRARYLRGRGRQELCHLISTPWSSNPMKGRTGEHVGPCTSGVKAGKELSTRPWHNELTTRPAKVPCTFIVALVIEPHGTYLDRAEPQFLCCCRCIKHPKVVRYVMRRSYVIAIR